MAAVCHYKCLCFLLSVSHGGLLHTAMSGLMLPHIKSSSSTVEISELVLGEKKLDWCTLCPLSETSSSF